ncbi:MAG: hypothetical protein ACREFC_04345 [Stellaceae bacterium]
MVGHNAWRRRLRRLERHFARHAAPLAEAEERRKEIERTQKRCRDVRAGLVALGHGPDQCAILVSNESEIARKLAGPAAPRAHLLEDPGTREQRKFLALIRSFSDPATPPPDFGNDSLGTIWAYVIARRPLPGGEPDSPPDPPNAGSISGADAADMPASGPGSPDRAR